MSRISDLWPLEFQLRSFELVQTAFELQRLRTHACPSCGLSLPDLLYVLAMYNLYMWQVSAHCCHMQILRKVEVARHGSLQRASIAKGCFTVGLTCDLDHLQLNHV